MVSRNNEILSKVLGMNEAQLASFLSSLKPNSLDYLDILIEKAGKDLPGLKKHLDSKK